METLHQLLREEAGRGRLDLGPVFLTSRAQLFLSVDPAASLAVPPGTTATIEFTVESRSPATRYSVTAGTGEAVPALQGRMVFPDQPGLAVLSVSPDSLILAPNQTAAILVRVRVPADSPVGSRHLLALTVRPVPAHLQPRTIQFYLTVSNSPLTPASPPGCRLLSSSYSRACRPARSCSSATWQADFTFSAPDGGLRAAVVEPGDPTAYWQTDSFILGSQVEQRARWVGSCCDTAATVTVTDLAGGRAECGAGRHSQQPRPALLVAVVVASSLLAILLVSSVATFFIIRRRRKVQLREMRDLPQQR